MFKTLSKFSIFFLLCHFASAQADEVSTSGDVRDPTAPLGYVSGGVTHEHIWVLDAVLVSPGRKLAVINGNTLREGQAIPGSNNTKVQRILPQAVVLQDGSQTRVLKLAPSVIKKHSSIQQKN